MGPKFKIVCAVAGFACACLALAVAQPAPAKDAVNVGIIDSLFDDKDEKIVNAQMKPFADLVRKQTGVEGEFGVVKGVDGMAQAFKDGKIQMAVLQGHEYGWLKQTTKDLKPLLVAVIEKPVVKAVFLVAKDSQAKSAADLKGETLAIGKKTPQFARFYLERTANGDPAKFFKTVEKDSVEDAIEDVVDGKAAGVLISEAALNVYKARKPGRFNRLRVLEESPDFPAAVLVYKTGQDREKEMEKFRQSLLKADDTPEGRQTLTLWRLSKFEDIPKDYENVVDEIVKKYPPPKP